MSQALHAELEERLLRYVQIDTQSDEGSPTSPSTDKQLDLLRLLVAELEAIGASDVTLTDYGAVLATIPATEGIEAPTVAFLGHVDTSPGFSGTDEGTDAGFSFDLLTSARPSGMVLT